jgi:hypothetical protein
MKTTLKFFVPTLLTFAFLIAFMTSTATVVQAQTTEDSAEVIADKNRLYEGCFLKDKAYNSADAAVKKAAMECGRDYLKKYEEKDKGDPDKAAITVYLRKKVDAYDKQTAADKEAARVKAIYDRYDNAYKAAKVSKNWTEVIAAGKAVLADDADDLDTVLDLAAIGFERVFDTPPNYTYNADTVNYAKSAISKIEAGKESGTKSYGVYFAYKTKTNADGKNNALGWMNYIVGFINNVGKTSVDKATVDSYYKAQQYKTSDIAKFPNVYQAIGSWYLAEFTRNDNDRVAKIKAAGEKETDDTKRIFALQKGIADRALEAYGRSYKVAKDVSTDTSATAAQRDAKGKFAASLMKTTITQIYQFRFDKKTVAANEVESYITGVLAKPFTEPNAAFVPVIAVVPVTPTMPAKPETTMPTKPMTTPKPVTTTPVKPAMPAKPVKKPGKK